MVPAGVHHVVGTEAARVADSDVDPEGKLGAPHVALPVRREPDDGYAQPLPDERRVIRGSVVHQDDVDGDGLVKEAEA